MGGAANKFSATIRAWAAVHLRTASISRHLRHPMNEQIVGPVILRTATWVA